jgi:hypothetical protein
MKQVIILVLLMVGLFGSVITPAFADMETLLEKLHEKGVLSDEEYQELRTEARAQRRAEALKEARDAEKAAKKTESAPTELSGRFDKEGLFTWESGDKENSISLIGRVGIFW